MTASLSAEERTAFVARCREVLTVATQPGVPDTMDEAKAFQGRLVEAGLAGLAYASEYGGAGLTQEHERIYREVAQEFPPMANKLVISHGMCLPVLNEFGTDVQKRQFMPDNIAARTVWCQMFSEPGAGSDVASLQTRAVRDGDEWTINGQKVWTTLAHESDYGVLIARTDPDQPKHAGISMFVVDMRAPGVEVRPIHQIDGGRHFNEVFFTDVRVPADWLLGTYNDGWRQATAMLMFERLAIGSMGAGAISQPRFDRLVEVARRSGAISDPVVRDQLMRMYAMETTKSLVAMRTRAEMVAGKPPGPGGSLGKLAGSIIAWRFREIAAEIAGPSAQAWTDGEGEAGQIAFEVITSFSAGIAGGTDEIQRNIIGERVLGLPRDIAVDRDVPFKDLKVGTQRAG
ncbi:MAG: acyl-CoA dehydrogenase family protein [Ilumatobacteraceae bacterium]